MSRWVQFFPDWSTWYQVKPSVSKWLQVKPSESKWVQGNPNETQWDPLHPPQFSYSTLVGLIGVYIHTHTSICIYIYTYVGGLCRNIQCLLLKTANAPWSRLKWKMRLGRTGYPKVVRCQIARNSSSKRFLGDMFAWWASLGACLWGPILATHVAFISHNTGNSQTLADHLQCMLAKHILGISRNEHKWTKIGGNEQTSTQHHRARRKLMQNHWKSKELPETNGN